MGKKKKHKKKMKKFGGLVSGIIDILNNDKVKDTIVGYGVRYKELEEKKSKKKKKKQQKKKNKKLSRIVDMRRD